jgi:ferrous iron transport protein A
MQTTLDQLKPGDEGTVIEISFESEAAERLMEMGVVPGTPFKVLKFAPLGDPIELVIRGYHLSLRRAEAATIAVQQAFRVQ